jgi:hypothetical protein
MGETDFKAYLSNILISEEEYRSGTLKEKAKFVKAFEKQKAGQTKYLTL